MVLERTIDNLRERPHHERRAVALGGSIFVMGVLTVGWAIIFFHSAPKSAAPDVANAYQQIVESAPKPPESVQWFSQSTQPSSQPAAAVESTSQNDVQIIEDTASPEKQPQDETTSP